MSTHTKKRITAVFLLTILVAFTALYIYPVFLMFLNSFKPFGEVVSDPIAIPKKPTWENFVYVATKIHYIQLFFNNVMITTIGIFGIVFFSSLAAYILDRRRYKYTKLIYGIIITPMLIPFQTIMITLLKAMNVIHLDQSRVSLGIQYWGFGIPMATFIFYNFMKTIPMEIDESAKIDGASTWKTYSAILFPLMKPVCFTVIVLDVMWIWNDFLLPLLMVNSSQKTKTLVLAAYTFVGQMNTKWQYAMAAMTLTVLPSILIFILLQKYIVEGVVAGAVKG